MLRLIGVRLAAAFGVLLAVSAIVFFGTEALPGDAATAVLGQNATPESLEKLRREHGLDRNALERYGEWLSGFATGDFGRSLVSSAPIAEIIGVKARNTIALATLTLALLLPLALALAVVAAMKRDKLADLGISAVTLVLIATPEFTVGSLIAVFLGVWLGLFPPVSLVNSSQSILSQLDLLALPALTLLAASLAQTIRMVRACLIDIMDSPFIQMTILKGVRPHRIILNHALPNALGPTIQVLVFNIAWLAGGVVIVENVFQYPGLGMELVKSVTTRDLPLVTTISMLITGTYVLANLAGEITSLLLNPRLRRSRAAT